MVRGENRSPANTDSCNRGEHEAAFMSESTRITYAHNERVSRQAIMMRFLKFFPRIFDERELPDQKPFCSTLGCSPH